MHANHTIITAAVLAACAACVPAWAGDSRMANANANAWIGRDAGDLLTQLRVDGGRVRIEEIEETGETTYTWTTQNAAYTETRVSGGGMGDQMNVFANPQLLNAFAAPPVREVKTIQHAATDRCQVTFFADMDGIVTRWTYDGPACRFDIKRPKR